MEELNSSELGTQEFWDERYKLEITNFRDHGEIGEIWFGNSSVKRICNWTYKEEKIRKSSKIIDIGCGNGVFLIELAKNNFTELYGVDYSPDAIVLAKEIAEKEKLKITYEVMDILNDNSENKYFVIHDKGTYDAISLSTDASKNRMTYIEKINKMLDNDGYYIITSCNWTKKELESHFTQFSLLNIIPTPQFTFGGQAGNTVTSLVFQKIA